jgi:hypothetical protein
VSSANGNLNGMDAFLANLQRAGDRQLAAAISASDFVMEKVLAESKELCPISPTNPYLQDASGKKVKMQRKTVYYLKSADGKQPRKVTKRFVNNPLYTGTSGALRDSGTAKPAVIKGGAITAEVGYNTDYAAAVHERTAVLHGAKLKAKYPGANIPNLKGQAKFLSIPILRWRRKAMDYIAGEMNRA